MAVYSVRIETDADWSAVEIRSAATWARAPGHALSFATAGGAGSGLRLWIDDRAVRLEPDVGAATLRRLVVQVATTLNRVLLHTTKATRGTLRVMSDVDVCVNDGHDDGDNPRDLVLFLGPEPPPASGTQLEDGAPG